MNDSDSYIFVIEFLKRRNDCTDRALYIALDDEVEVLDLAFLNLAEELFQRRACVSCENFFSEFLLTVVCDFFRDLILLNRIEFIAGFRYIGKAENFNRCRRACLS